MNIERTPLGQQEFDRQCPDVSGLDDSPYAVQNRLIRTIQQSIMGEHGFPTDPNAAEDEMFYRLGELIDEGVLTNEEGVECFGDWVRQQRADSVIHLGEIVARPFYE